MTKVRSRRTRCYCCYCDSAYRDRVGLKVWINKQNGKMVMMMEVVLNIYAPFSRCSSLEAVDAAGSISTMPFFVPDANVSAHCHANLEFSMLDRAIDNGCTAEPCSSSNLDGGGVLGLVGGGRCHDGHAESHNEKQHCFEKLHSGRS
jgi:hypothetical protein